MNTEYTMPENLSIKDLLEEGWAGFKDRWTSIMGFIVVTGVILFLLALVMGLALSGTNSAFAQIVNYLVQFLGFVLYGGALSYMVKARSGEVNFSEFFTGFTKIGDMLVLKVFFFVLDLPWLVAVYFVSGSFGSVLEADMLTNIGYLAGTMLVVLLLYLVYQVVIWSLFASAIPMVTLRGMKAIDAIKQSLNGHKAKLGVVGFYLLLVSVITILAYFLVMFLVSVMGVFAMILFIFVFLIILFVGAFVICMMSAPSRVLLGAEVSHFDQKMSEFGTEELDINSEEQEGLL